MGTALDPAMGLHALRAPQRSAGDWPGFITLFEDLRRKSSSWPSDLERVRLWYEPHLERIHEDAAARRGDLMQLEQIAANYPSRERFLTDLTLDPPAASSDHAGPPHHDDDYLVLSTIHSAKGQEWKNVFVLNVVDGCIPACLGAGQRKEIEEERRLLYVAMTRAKDSLHLLLPQRFYVENQVGRGDRHVYALRSRFIADHALPHFEQSTWPKARADARTGGAKPRASIDLRAKMRGTWK